MTYDMWREIIHQLADVPSAASTQVGIALLDRADERTGQVNLAWADLLLITGCQSRNAARRHLTALKQAGIIHFSTNENVYITFLAWFDASKTARQRAEIDADESGDDGANAETARQRAEINANGVKTARQRAETGGGKGRVELSIDLPTTNEGSNPTQPPTDQNDEPTALQRVVFDLDGLKPADRWSFDLLTDPDIALMPENALRCAKLHTPAWVVRQVAAWWLARDELAVNVLAWRLLNPGKSQAGPASPAFLASELYARHYPLSKADAVKWEDWQNNGHMADILVEGAPIDPRPGWPPGVAELVEKLPAPTKDPKARNYDTGGGYE